MQEKRQKRLAKKMRQADALITAKHNPKRKKQYLPLSKSTFSKYVEDNCIYVDKTSYIHPLVQAGGAYFLSRPRRFGKSLMVSVLREIFQGNRELFNGYWIYDRIDWKKYPVIHLDFLKIDSRALGIEKALANELERIAQSHGIPCSGDSISEKFNFLIDKLALEQRIVILIDEYDKPVTDYLEDINTAVYNRDILRNFYSVLKSQEGKIKFLFMTGISRFTRLSIFSELNHLIDITFHKDYSKLLGYTDEEIEIYFDAYIREWLRLHKGSKKSELMEKLKDYYNGYSWNGKDFVYNPYSINYFFYSMEFKNYWFASGTTTSLVKLIKEKNIAVENWEYLEVREQFFDKFDIANININLMLFQTGYLTVKKRLEDTYVLSYPNREVEHALLNNLMEAYSGHSLEDTEKLIKDIKESLEKEQLDFFIDQMKAFIASIPYNLVEAGAERFYYLVFYLVLKLLIGKVYPEKYTNLGRIDTVVETSNFIYVFEFKMGSAAEALMQILEKKYYEQYLVQPKKIILLGIGFSVKDRNISGFEFIEGNKEDLSGYINKTLTGKTGDFQTKEKHTKSLELLEKEGRRQEMAVSYHQLGNIAFLERDFAEAKRCYWEVLKLKQEFNDRYGQASTYHQLGMVAQEERDFAEAKRCYWEALKLKQEFNDRYGQADTYHQLGMVAEEERDFDEAKRCYREVLKLKQEFNDRYGQASTYHQLGMVAQEERDFTEVLRDYSLALEIFLQYHDDYIAGIVKRNLASLFTAWEPPDSAIASLESSDPVKEIIKAILEESRKKSKED